MNRNETAIRLNGTKIVFKKKIPYALIGVLPALFYLANLYRMTGHSSSLYLLCLYIAGITGFLFLFIGKRIDQRIIVPFLSVYLITELVNCLFIGNIGYQDLISDILLFGITIVMFVYPITYRMGCIFFYISIAVFFYGYLTNSSTVTFLTSSRNYISVLLILATALYYIALQNAERKIKLVDLLPAFFCFWLSIWATGRGGILSSSVLFALVVMFYARNYAKQSARHFLILCLIIMLIVIYLLASNVNLLDSFMNLGKWSSRGTDNSARMLIWSSYFEKLKDNFLYIFTGAPLNQISLIHAYNNNTHNSFLQLHANNGLLTFAMFFILMLRTLVYYKKSNKGLFIAITITIVVRGMTDKFIFGQYGMPIMMYLVLYPYAKMYVGSRK